MIDSPLLLLVVMALIAVIPLALRRHRAATPDGLRVVSRTALSKSSVVAVVAVGRRRLLVGAGDHGVQLLAEVTGEGDLAGVGGGAGAGHLDAVTDLSTTTTDEDLSLYGTTPSLGRTDADGTTPAGSPLDDDALEALVTGAAPAMTTAGPRIGLVDRLRAMTVRTPTQGRPFHVPLRR